MKNENKLKNFTRGGQITLHNIRMYIQIMDKVLILTIVIFLAIVISNIWISTTFYERYVYGEYAWSSVVPLFNGNSSTQFILPNGEIRKVKYTEIHNAPFIKEIVGDVHRKLLHSLLNGLVISFSLLLGIDFWLRRRGEKHTKNSYVKGDKILNIDETKKLIIKEKKNSDLILAGFPLIKNTETAHLFFHGTTGTGKSNAIKELLEQIRKRGDRAIIYDKSCSYLEEFFQPKTDVLFNPLDERGKEWDLWLECRDSADFDSLAAAQIPMPSSTQDPFWVNAARTIFSAAAFEMRNDKDRSIIKLLRYLLTADLDLIQRYLKGTEAETLVSEKNEKTAVSIKSVLATYLKSLKYVKDGNHPFSIRQWIQDDTATNWLFITSLGDRHETLKPLISSWIDIAVNALLSLKASQSRRIWLILDELTSLQPLPYLTQTLSESRKFGGCIVIGIQNYAQLAKLYGQEGAREISSLLNTRIMFRQPDPDMAKWSAINFGESFVEEVREGISYGANTMRDGISINRIESGKQLISYSEVMSLNNLNAYVRLPGNFPITLIEFKYKDRKKPNIGLLQRNMDENNMKNVNELIEKSEKNIKNRTHVKKQLEEELLDQALDI